MATGGIDWLRASQAERKILYRFIKRLADEENRSVPAFLQNTVGVSVPDTPSYGDNMRAGRMSRKIAHQAVIWIAANREDVANELERAVPGAARETRLSFNTLIIRHGAFERIGIVKMPEAGLDLIRVRRPEPLLDRPLYLGEDFKFQFDAPSDGFVLGFQKFDRRWYPLPLAADRLYAKVSAGTQLLPVDPSPTDPLPLSEDETPGKYHFAFALLERLPLAGMDQYVALETEIAGAAETFLIDLLFAHNQPREPIYRASVIFRS